MAPPTPSIWTPCKTRRNPDMVPEPRLTTKAQTTPSNAVRWPNHIARQRGLEWRADRAGGTADRFRRRDFAVGLNIGVCVGVRAAIFGLMYIIYAVACGYIYTLRCIRVFVNSVCMYVCIYTHMYLYCSWYLFNNASHISWAVNLTTRGTTKTDR